MVTVASCRVNLFQSQLTNPIIYVSIENCNKLKKQKSFQLNWIIYGGGGGGGGGQFFPMWFSRIGHEFGSFKLNER